VPGMAPPAEREGERRSNRSALLRHARDQGSELMSIAFRCLRRLLAGAAALAAAALLAGHSLAAGAVEFTQETLDNGLQVIYAPLHQAPVVHVRVLYHVGSRDERPDRRGFAHMFEHMMFRGSAHVKAEEHMRLVGMVGGNSNAFTSFDQTVYVNTLPSSQLELALYLEADRMASFRVSDEIYQTERKVVTEEWRMKQNRPYGRLWDDFVAAVFTRHSYRWTPIGDMDNLRAAQAAELQDFFDRYYVPNNAILVIAGDIDVTAAGALARKYFGWVKRGADIKRDIPAEPAQTAGRRVEIRYRVPNAKVMIGFAAVPYRSDDNYALSLLGTILGGGRSGRLDRALVYGARPLCVDVGASDWTLEDAGVFLLSATVLGGRESNDVEKGLLAAVAEVRRNGVTREELEKAKVQARLSLVRERETATSIAGALGEAALLGGDPNRVNTELAKINAVTVGDVKAAANKYLVPARATTLHVVPDEAAPSPAEDLAPAAPDTRPIVARRVEFPEGYPAKPPVAATPPAPRFEKGVETSDGGIRIIVMPDSRLPLVNWSLTMRRGSDSDPPDKAGLAALTASLVRRGVGGLSFAQLNEDLESRGIGIEVSSGDDFTRLSGSSMTDQLDHAMQRSRLVLREPTFAADEFAKRKEQLLNQLRLEEENPGRVAQDDLMEALYDATPLGRHATPATVAGITLEDVKAFWQATYRPNDAVLVISGDVTVDRGQELAKALLADWPPAPLAAVDYAPPKAPDKRTIIVVDRPDGKQSTIRLGIRSYDLRSEEKFAGDLASRILSAGIDSRLGRAVRAQKGLAYSVWATFRPGRHGGVFSGGTDTTIPSTADAIEAILKVFDVMRSAEVAADELAEAKLRVTGSMVMGMQTIAQQAAYRTEGILNGYPVDYYDKYPARVSQVAAGDIRQVVDKYVRPDRMVIVVVAPADQVKDQLARLGEVRVVPMPARRGK
jgi:zinc protease